MSPLILGHHTAYFQRVRVPHHTPQPHSHSLVSAPGHPAPSLPLQSEWGERRGEGFSSICGCSQDLIELEREKLEVLKDQEEVDCGGLSAGP
ncbi:hypothetical protein SKAU_G00271450 [Synaphobranchus kaupii]|uniref:Uncharacterized protein n=1 Tax=Synaphobranchus kaupii TaxID=118154 RepID=A0A9Q1IQN0_SYNKA|nr:hypothetical protein SKAU_G00271450 [Synaphobranchus kaupii]